MLNTSVRAVTSIHQHGQPPLLTQMLFLASRHDLETINRNQLATDVLKSGFG